MTSQNAGSLVTLRELAEARGGEWQQLYTAVSALMAKMRHAYPEAQVSDEVYIETDENNRRLYRGANYTYSAFLGDVDNPRSSDAICRAPIPNVEDAKIVIGEGYLQKSGLSPDMVLPVVAHEYGHAALGHRITRKCNDFIRTTMNEPYHPFRRTAEKLVNRSRQWEFDADTFALVFTGHSNTRQNLAKMTTNDEKTLYYDVNGVISIVGDRTTHPYMHERLACVDERQEQLMTLSPSLSPQTKMAHFEGQSCGKQAS